MQTLDLVQGSEEWKEIRGKFCVASEAPIIMGASPHIRRDELLRMKTTGDEKEISRWTQIIFDRGHEAEALARPFAEAYLEEELYPIVGINDADYLASFDGITMLGNIVWECKQFNQALWEIVTNQGELGPQHYWQLEHQLYVSEADYVLFTVSNGTEEYTAHMVYQSRPERRTQLIEGWKLFLEDLQDYQPIVIEKQPEGVAPENLPALIVDVESLVKSSNLPEFKSHAVAVLNNINTELNTDEDFAIADKTVKWCEDVEAKIKLTKEMVLNKAGDIYIIMQALDSVQELARDKRLILKNGVDRRKKEIRMEIVNFARSEWKKHLDKLSKEVAPAKLPDIKIDIAGAMKNKRTLLTLRSAANDELARAKIEANIIAEQLKVNVAGFNTYAQGFEYLFKDKQDLFLKEPDDLEPLIKQRIAEHRKELEEREAAEKKKREEREAAEKKKQEEEKLKAEMVAPALTDSSEKIVVTPKQQHPFASNAKFFTEFVKQRESSRPSDDEIIFVLAEHFGVQQKEVIDWLSSMNLEALMETA